MKFEGVTFIEHALNGMSRKDFIALHENKFWLDKDKAVRRKMLEQAYGILNPQQEESE